MASLEIRSSSNPDGSGTKYYFDENGDEVRVEDFDEYGNLVCLIERQYKSPGICTGWLVLDSEGRQIKRFEIILDSQDLELETLQFNSENELERKFKQSDF